MTTTAELIEKAYDRNDLHVEAQHEAAAAIPVCAYAIAAYDQVNGFPEDGMVLLGEAAAYAMMGDHKSGYPIWATLTMLFSGAIAVLDTDEPDTWARNAAESAYTAAKSARDTALEAATFERAYVDAENAVLAARKVDAVLHGQPGN